MPSSLGTKAARPLKTHIEKLETLNKSYNIPPALTTAIIPSRRIILTPKELITINARRSLRAHTWVITTTVINSLKKKARKKYKLKTPV